MAKNESAQSLFRSGWAKTGLIAAVVMAATCVYQWNAVYGPERDRLQASIQSAQDDLKKVQVIAERWPEFVEEHQGLEKKLAELERKLPSVTMMVSFAIQIDDLADELGVEVQVRPEPSSVEAFDFYFKHRFGLVLSGPDRAVTAFRERVQEKWPLTVWVEEGRTPEAHNLGLILWSRSESGGSADRRCRIRGEPRLLWPFSNWTSDLREELEETCVGVRHSRLLLEQVDHFERMAQEIATSEAIIAQIEQHARPAEVEASRSRSGS
jgi:hypothetical protein